MTTVIPVDEFITDEWYPGFKEAFDRSPWGVDSFRTFSKADENQMWFLEFHTPRGLTPLAFLWATDGLTWATQITAERVPLPPARGYAARIAGTHPYVSTIPVSSEYELAERGRRFAAMMPSFMTNYEQIWADLREEIEQGWQHFRGQDLSTMDLPQLAQYMRDARAFHRRAYEIHFDVIYPVTANYVGFRGLCIELGIEADQIGKFLQGYDTKIMETDRALWTLATEARTAGLEPIFQSTEAENLLAELKNAGSAAAGWLSKFDEFLDTYGWRTEGSCDIALPSWVEEPTPALGMIKSFLLKDADHDFDAAQRSAVEERDTAIDAARSSLTVEEQRTFDSALQAATRVNLPWWLDDHNYYLDLRVALPLRWGARAIASKVDADAADDTMFLFWPELMQVAVGERKFGEFRSLIGERRDFFEQWARRRATMPKAVGLIPDSAKDITDPTMSEIFGINDHFLDGIRASVSSDPVRKLTGVAAARGKARATARVLTSSDELHRVNPGDILVCESTSPNWTPAFAKIAGCVCDIGGMLSHAAVVGREYGVPTVTALATATLLIEDGDEVEVDGTTGTVTVYKRNTATHDSH